MSAFYPALHGAQYNTCVHGMGKELRSKPTHMAFVSLYKCTCESLFGNWISRVSSLALHHLNVHFDLSSICDISVAGQVRLCPEHAQQLNFRKNQEALRAQQKAAKRQKLRRSGDADSSRGNFDEPSAAPLGAVSGQKRRRDSNAEPARAGGESAQGEVASMEDPGGGKEGGAAEGGAEEVNVWKGKQPQLEASKDEEFDEYFNGMFL